ncbi:hypothetical protein Q31a_40860 [Aureliella helgolandensis]|uniref:Uncharacterized protein n=1 Tax=Aureliella helgolandensis TaxID=2527968 RepID=A0A518GB06_9BACT|nr:hypothetical protein Q31a_40860 [Aureliella helgolandensis]
MLCLDRSVKTGRSALADFTLHSVDTAGDPERELANSSAAYGRSAILQAVSTASTYQNNMKPREKPNLLCFAAISADCRLLWPVDAAKLERLDR